MPPWVIVAAGFVCLIGEAIGTYAFTPALKPIVEDLGWTRTQFSLSGLFVSLVMMAAVPVAGMLTDRGWARVVLAFGAISLGASMYLFSRMETLAQFYAITVLMGAGVGCVGGVPTTALVSRWFDARRGLALGLTGLGHNAGGLLLPPAITAIIGVSGWRPAFELVAYFVWLVILPTVVLLVRDRPAASAPAAATGAVHTDESSDGERVSLRDGIKSSAFWLLALTMFLHVLYFAGVTVHFVAFATDVGLAPETAATAFGVMLGLGMVGRPAFGWAADRFPRRPVMIAALLLTVVASLLLQRITAPGALPAFVVLQGLGVVGAQTVFALLVAAYFGAVNVGAFLGVLMAFQVPGGVLGAILAAASFDQLGSYTPIFWTFTAGNLIATLAVARLRPYHATTVSDAVLAAGRESPTV